MKEIIASAPGRICLAGEKLDWLVNGQGITCTLDDLSLTVRLKTLSSNTASVFSQKEEKLLKLEEFSLPFSGTRSEQSYFKAVFLAFGEKGANISDGVEISIDSKIPQGLGLSSSAALCTGLAGAISEWQDLYLTPAEIAHIAYMAEKEILGIRCGQMDQYAVVFGGLCLVNSAVIPATVMRFEDKLKGYSILIANPGKVRATNTVNIEIKNRMETGDETVNKYINETTKIVEYLSILLQSNRFDIYNLGKAITEAHFLLSECLGVSNSLLDRIVKEAVRAGAYGAKLGSGKGGVVFAITEDSKTKSVAKAMTLEGVQLILTKMGSNGLNVKVRI
ncbi:MAG: hypothetical protein V1858_00320 [Candidatus Gottesmanbacteria bacterium]